MFYDLNVQRLATLARVRKSILKMEFLKRRALSGTPEAARIAGILERLRRKEAGLLPANDAPVTINSALTAADFDEPHATGKLWRRAQLSLKLIARRIRHAASSSLKTG